MRREFTQHLEPLVKIQRSCSLSNLGPALSSAELDEELADCLYSSAQHEYDWVLFEGALFVQQRLGRLQL